LRKGLEPLSPLDVPETQEEVTDYEVILPSVNAPVGTRPIPILGLYISYTLIRETVENGQLRISLTQVQCNLTIS